MPLMTEQETDTQYESNLDGSTKRTSSGDAT